MKLTAPWRRRWGLNPRAVADLSHFECDPFTTWVLLQILLTCKTASDRTRIEQLKNYLYSNSECNRNRIKSRFSAARLPHCPTDFECGALRPLRYFSMLNFDWRGPKIMISSRAHSTSSAISPHIFIYFFA
ncbi:MAG: hypothetical protein PWP27_2187 [Clostridiales bacterium]|nr:hypothetical protein [Clostridiales bacterium]